MTPGSVLPPRQEDRSRLYPALLGGTFVLHAVLAAITPVSGDEAYYWDCARHWDWSSFDQPLLMIWPINFFRMVFGETSLAVRMPAICASFLLGLFLLGLFRRFGGGKREAVFGYLLLHGMPLFFLGSFYESTDIGMSAAYLAATWAAVALAQGERSAWWGFALATGLGFLAKFPIVLVFPALIPALFTKETRAHLRTPTPWLAALLSFLLTMPVWIWAALHEWDNIRFQLEGRHKAAGLSLKHLGEFIAANFLLATPFLAVAMLVAFVGFLKKKEPGRISLVVAAAMPFVFFGTISLREGVGGHWGGPGLVLGAAILVMTPFRGRKQLVGLGTGMGLVLSVAVILVAVFPERLLDPDIGGKFPVIRHNTRALGRLIGNREILEQLEKRRRPGEALFFTSYSDVHLFALLSGGVLPTRLANIAGGTHGLASLYWYPAGDVVGRDLTLISDKETRSETWLRANCDSVEKEAPIVVRRNGEILRSLAVFRCSGLRRDDGLFGRGRPMSSSSGRGSGR